MKMVNEEFEFKIKNIIRQRLYNSFKQRNTKELIGCTIPEYKKYLEEQFKEGMTWDNHGTVWYIDHIRPCASFDLRDPLQQQMCFNYKNTQPLEVKDNLSKGAKFNDQIKLSDFDVHLFNSSTLETQIL